MMFWIIIAQTSSAGIEAGWAQLGFATVITSLLIFVITKGVPSLLEKQDERTEKLIERADLIQTQSREHFEKILQSVEERHTERAKDGHDAARRMVDALDKHTAAVVQTCEAVRGLAKQVKQGNQN